MLFPAANDLLTMFVALEVLSLPLYLLSGLARRRRLLSQEAALKYFLLGALLLGVLPLRLALLYGYAGSLGPARRSPTAITTAVRRLDGLLLLGIGAACSSACCSRSAPCRSTRGPPTSTRAPRPRSPASWPPAPRSRPSARCCAFFYVGVGAEPLGLAAGAVGRRDPHHGRRRGARGHPDRHQADAGLLLDRARRASSSSACWPSSQAGDRRRAVLPGRLRLRHVGAFALVALVAPGRLARPRTCRSGPAWAAATRSSPATFAFLLLAFAGIPLTTGFIGKFAVFAAAVAAGAGGALLVVIAVLASAIAAFFYVRRDRAHVLHRRRPATTTTSSC